MRIALLVQYYPLDEGSRNLYSDLMDEIAAEGHEVCAFRSDEGRAAGGIAVTKRKGVKVVSVPTGRVTKTGKVEKAINTVLSEPRYLGALKKMYGRALPDLVVASTPPITFCGCVEYCRKRGVSTYLLLKDIFPQNAVDLGMLRDGSLIHRYFRNKEQRLYRSSMRIGCMSPANVEYLLHHNSFLDGHQVEVNPNSITAHDFVGQEPRERGLLKKYGIPYGKTLFVYGGNLGKPQGIGFLLDIITEAANRKDVHFVIVGSGTEYPAVEAFLRDNPGLPATLIRYLPNGEYFGMLRSMDVGLIFLDPRFTIPNFPSRVLDYFDAGLPVLAATDTSTDFGRMLESSGAGKWCESGDLDLFMKNMDLLAKDSGIRQRMGRNGRSLLDSEFHAKRSAQLITEKVD